jgi:hypothetical protein
MYFDSCTNHARTVSSALISHLIHTTVYLQCLGIDQDLLRKVLDKQWFWYGKRNNTWQYL